MADGVDWSAKARGAPLPVSKRPPIRPVGVRPLSGLLGFVIVAAVLQALLMAWGIVLFDGLRRDLALNRDDGPWDDAWVERWIKTEGLGPGEGEPEDHAEAVRRSDYRRSMRLQEHGTLRRWFFWSALGAHVLDLVAFILWQVRAHSNLAALGSVGLRYGSTSSVVWWFVPVAVLWRPLGVLQDERCRRR